MEEKRTEAGRTPAREEIDASLKWRVEDMFADGEAWERERESLASAVDALAAFRGRLGSGAETALDCLRARDELFARLDGLVTYAALRHDEDVADGSGQARFARALAFHSESASKAAFIEPELLSLDPDKIGRYMSENPGIAVYRHFFDDLARQREHVLSAREEELLALSADALDAANDAFSMLVYADMKFPKVKTADGQLTKLTEARYSTFMEDPNRDVRKRAFRALFKTYGAYKNTLASTYASSVKRSLFFARARGYESSLAMSLDGGSIPASVYDALCETVESALPELARYLRLRRKALGLGGDALRMYDLYAPLTPRYDRRVSFDEAKRITLDALAPLGTRYIDDLAAGMNGGWIDVCETRNKRGGAYCTAAYYSHPYALLNYQGRLDDVLTLAHEMGHAMHFRYSHEAQPIVYSGHSIFVAEVASTVNETLVLDALIKAAENDGERAFLLARKLESIRTTVFRQTMFARFEREAHNMQASGEALTADSLSAAYKELNDMYYASEVAVDGEIALEWARIPHFYTPFYVYQYATGLSAALSLAEGIRAETEAGRKNRADGAELGAVARYLEFLSAGSADYPIETLRRAGVDLSDPRPVKDAMAAFSSALTQLEELL